MDAAVAATNWWAEIGKGGIALALGFLGAVFIERYKARASKGSSSASYLETIASLLEEISDALEQGRDADKDTHMLYHMIRGLRVNLPHLVDEGMLNRLHELAGQHYRPSTWPPRGTHPEQKEAKEWIVRARKTAGNLRAQAQLKRAK
jgi:hypothetical protein